MSAPEVLVTGGTGALGRRAVERFEGAGVGSRVISRSGFMLLTHRGRRSGRVYQTALEVVRYDPSLRETGVASGWGEVSDWYRNLKAHPALEIRTGRDRYAPEQRFLTPEEIYREIVDYERRHPWAVRIVPSLLGFRLDGSDVPRRPSPIQCGWWPSDLDKDNRAVGVLRRRVRGGPPQAREEHAVTSIFGLLEKDAGLLVEQTAAIAWENYQARFNHALCMGYGGFSEGSYCLLAEDYEEGRILRMEVHE